MLAAARGRASARIAADLYVSVDTVRKWRGRFAARGLDRLKDLPQSGRPRRITALEQAAVCALACQLPATTGVPLSRWNAPELTAELAAQGLVSAILPSSVVLILAEHPIKPWQYQSRVFPRDPDFAARATVVLDLYHGYYQGNRLRPWDRIVSVDAKPSIQARARFHATGPPGPGRPVRVEHEYDRAGARALLAALDVHAGKVCACCPQTTGIAPSIALMSQVMSRQRPAGVRHRRQRLRPPGSKAVRWLRDAYPNAIMIHTPVHASWLNQVEIVFSIVQKKVISPNDVISTARPATTLPAFTGRYNQTAEPFNWKFTAADLTGLLRRLSARREPASHTAGLPEAA